MVTVLYSFSPSFSLNLFTRSKYRSSASNFHLISHSLCYWSPLSLDDPHPLPAEIVSYSIMTVHNWWDHKNRGRMSHLACLVWHVKYPSMLFFWGGGGSLSPFLWRHQYNGTFFSSVRHTREWNITELQNGPWAGRGFFVPHLLWHGASFCFFFYNKVK